MIVNYNKKMINNIDYILFDLDGTITDPKEGITNSVEYALQKLNITIQNKNDLIAFIGPPLIESFSQYYGLSENDLKMAISYYREYFSKKGILENTPYTGIHETLKKLKAKKYTLAIATSKPTLFAKQILEYFELSQYFEHIVGSNLDNTRCSKDEIIKECQRLFNDYNNDKYIMIGDRKHDILGAKKIGIYSIGVLYGYGEEQEIVKESPDFIINNHHELLNIL